MPEPDGFTVRLVRKRSISITAALLAVVAGLGAGTASAATTRTRPADVARAAGPAGTRVNDATEPGVCSTCAPPLKYSSGGSVMAAGSTLTITPIYWAPTGSSYSNAYTAAGAASYQSIINQYITDIAADSGKTSNVYGILPQYYQTVNGVTTNVKYSFAAGTPLTDTDAYPTTGQCTSVNSTDPNQAPYGSGYTACITNAQLQAELTSYITANKLPTGLNQMYLVFFPELVQTQLGTGSTAAYSNAQFCGYHSSFSMNGNPVVYGNEPYPAGCYSASAPSGDPYSDGQINTVSHEISEAITDPLSTAPGWFDSAKPGNEIGDECAGNYGAAVGTVSPADGVGAQSYNQKINGDFYYTQTEFSNSGFVSGSGNGCRQVPVGMSPRHGVRHDQAGLATQLSVDPSPSSLPADGTSTSTVTITATDANGDPVAGDPVSVIARDDNATPGGCGGLTPGGPGQVQATNAAGQVTVTYTASNVSSNCYIMATDTTGGVTDQALIYQGSEQPDAPSITQSTLPSQLVSGGPSASFTASASNPSSGSDIPDARFGVSITGDDTASTGIDASQLTLSYKDDATAGDYINVPLSGTTTNGGQISGLVSPDTTEALAAGITRHADFQLSLAGAAADTATTGNNLQIQIVLDQYNPADGSLDTLDATTPGDVPVVQAPGVTVTYAGKLVTTSPPSGTNPGTAVLEAKTCQLASLNNAACRLTGTASYTASGGTLTGTITTEPAAGVPDLVITFTDNFTTSSGGGTGTGTGQVIYFDNGNYSTQNLAAIYQSKQDPLNPNVQEQQGTLTFTNPTAAPFTPRHHPTHH